MTGQEFGARNLVLIGEQSCVHQRLARRSCKDRTATTRIMILANSLGGGIMIQISRRDSLKIASYTLLPLVVGSTRTVAVASSQDEINVKDLGAIGDGHEHKVCQWISTGRFANLREIQAVYPDVVSHNDLIDHAAINLAIRRAALLGKPVHIPAGIYRAFVIVPYSGIRIFGDGSDLTTIRLPDNASHSVPVESSGERSIGVPCVIDFNNIGLGNSSLPLADAQISGLTVDGNCENTRVPDTDLHGWGISFTRYSRVAYHDIRAINCHLGGIGTFIDSNNHHGEASVENCGFSHVDGDGRPGFDINSSSHGHWKVRVVNCWHGARMIDNCRDNRLEVEIVDAINIGMTAGNQIVNESQDNVIMLTVNGGCVTAGLQVGQRFHTSSFIAKIVNVQGPGAHTVPNCCATAARGCVFNLVTQGCGGQSALIQGSWDRFVIDSSHDGRNGGQGAVFAIDVEGSHNVVAANIIDGMPWKVRGIALRRNAAANEIAAYNWPKVADPLHVENPRNGNRLPRRFL